MEETVREVFYNRSNSPSVFMVGDGCGLLSSQKLQEVSGQKDSLHCRRISQLHQAEAFGGHSATKTNMD